MWYICHDKLYTKTLTSCFRSSITSCNFHNKNCVSQFKICIRTHTKTLNSKMNCNLKIKWSHLIIITFLFLFSVWSKYFPDFRFLCRLDQKNVFSFYTDVFIPINLWWRAWIFLVYSCRFYIHITLLFWRRRQTKKTTKIWKKKCWGRNRLFDGHFSISYFYCLTEICFFLWKFLSF